MASATIGISEAIKKVSEMVEKIINDEDQHFPAAASIGDAVRQGDVYIQLIDNFTETPAFYKKVANPQFPIQLAPGNTKGSRHMLEASEGVEVYSAEFAEVGEATDEFGEIDFELSAKLGEKLQDYARQISAESEADARKFDSKTGQVFNDLSSVFAFCGPIVVLSSPGCISHPEHGNWLLPPGTYRITFQRTLDADMRVRRVFD